ncbi:uncharacterized protein LOC130508182 isoform X2 [Raphanus sativus]|uniref:Uncharacterized protein LOC108813221 isoform X2 n=1 Tax=Raphanus sativus TaxID=3726 RepID=A0A9W3CXH4_RAPSA|nr:uncharacterized protein LOC108813221 isoform X2 [Raphanus sativus]XP_056859481.1 uncharacterized protein LOC130508182 isoform X2 [Raphanus sativus]
MASHSYPIHGFSVQGITKSRAYLVNSGVRRQESIIPENSFDLKIQHLGEPPCKAFSSLRNCNHFMESDSNMLKHRLLDVHETRQEEVVEFLLSTTEDELKERGAKMSLLSNLNQEQMKPLLDVMIHNQEFSINPDAQILFSSSRSELNDMVSIAAKLNKSDRWRKLSLLVPQSQRLDSEVLIETLQPDEVNLDAVTTLAPQKTKAKQPSRKKHNPKLRDRENDLYKRNHLHACESLISLMIGSEQHRQTTMLSLKKSSSRGEDLSELLTQLSIGFAGSGIAVFFSVVCSAASGRVPFCANKVFDAGLSLSLVLLSWAVSRLREAIVGINRKAIKGEETTNRVERRIKDVYFRAATVIVMVALRFH